MMVHGGFCQGINEKTYAMKRDYFCILHYVKQVRLITGDSRGIAFRHTISLSTRVAQVISYCEGSSE